MSLLRGIVCLLLPPAAVYDKGCGSILLVTVLWLLGWVPGVIAAMIICTRVEPT
ncbi:MAG: YqaE/Pmp3 family membrane protein [Candidatus Hydrogenedentes bacterium]|nr:YqaE/Pmp3 family membrane protein [Candidatus Hydrogenedentota bacterium]